jgi:hypothetical protein
MSAGARLGKSGGALVQQALVLLFGSILRGAPVIALLFYASVFAWIGTLRCIAVELMCLFVWQNLLIQLVECGQVLLHRRVIKCEHLPNSLCL